MIRVGDIVMYCIPNRGHVSMPAIVVARDNNDGSLTLRVFTDDGSCPPLVENVTLGRDQGQWHHRD